VFLSTSEYTDNPYWLELYRDCLKNDIEIVDPLPEMWKRYNEFPLCYFYHIPEEGHPFTGGSFIIADVLSNVLKRYTEQSDADSFVLSESAYVSPGRRNRAYYPTGNSKYDPTKLMSFPVVLSKKTNAVPSLESNTESPFLFCSNSFGAYPSRMAGGSIPHYTIYRTGIIPAWFYQDGIGMSMLRHCVTKPQILQNRKAVILIMHPNMWWEPISAFPVSIKLNITQMVLEKAILPADVQKSISMKEHSDEAIGILSADNLSLSLNHYQEKSDFFFSIPSSEKDKHLPHIIRVNF